MSDRERELMRACLIYAQMNRKSLCRTFKEGKDFVVNGDEVEGGPPTEAELEKLIFSLQG